MRQRGSKRTVTIPIEDLNDAFRALLKPRWSTGSARHRPRSRRLGNGRAPGGAPVSLRWAGRYARPPGNGRRGLLPHRLPPRPRSARATSRSASRISATRSLKPSMSSRTRICPSLAVEAPMPMVTVVMEGVVAMARATGSTMPSSTMAKAPRIADRLAVLHQLALALLAASLHAKPAHRVHGLGGEADMAHHRNTPLHEKRDRLGETGAALHLDRAGAGLLQHAGGAHECLLRARLVGSRTACPRR